MNQPVVAVTGGTGFIGTHLVNELLGSGRRVRVLARQNRANLSRFPLPPSPGGSWAGPEVAWGDIRDAAAVERAMEGAEIVFHLAAYARAWASRPLVFDAVNVEGTRNLCEAARRQGVRRVVHVSTELVDQSFPGDTPYQRAKRTAEETVHAYVSRGGDAVIARPTRVYGPGPLNQANTVTRVIALYRRGLFRTRITDGGARANYVYVSDVVDGLMRAAARGKAGAAYLLGGENLTLEQLLGLVHDATGRRHLVLSVPKSVAKGVASLCELGGLFGIEPMITSQWVDLLTQDRPMSSALAEAELEYRPRSAKQGIAETVAWLEAGCPPNPQSAIRNRQ